MYSEVMNKGKKWNAKTEMLTQQQKQMKRGGGGCFKHPQ